MKPHPRRHVIMKIEHGWAETPSGEAAFNYADFIMAFVIPDLFPGIEPSEEGMIEAMRADFLQVCEKHDPTPGERLAAIAGILRINSQYLVRTEREETA